MRKELFIAIFLGGFIGIAVAFGAWRFSNSLSKSPEEVRNEIAKQVSDGLQQLSQDGENTGSFTITRPQNNSVSSSSSIQVAGSARENSNLLIIGSNDYVVNVKDGSFDEQIEIVGGINQIPVYMFTDDGKTEETSVLVVYSSGVENVENARVALGTITDITESSIQIRTSTGEISQVAISSETTYVSTVQNTRDIQFADLAIGDFVAAIGEMAEGDEVVDAQRVIVSSPLEEDETIVAYGTVQTLTSRDFIVKNENTGDEWSIDAKDSPRVTTLNEDGEIVTARLTATAEEGDWIIIVGEMDGDELIARRIHIL